MTINDDKKCIELNTYYSSTDKATIKNLRADQQVVSFEMIPFPSASDSPLRLVATRERKLHSYKVNAVGLWNLFTKNKLAKIEWKQVPSIKLPYTTKCK
jgi:hypothetical protein